MTSGWPAPARVGRTGRGVVNPGTINGMGERAGNADIGEIALPLHCLYDVPVALDLTIVREVPKS